MSERLIGFARRGEVVPGPRIADPHPGAGPATAPGPASATAPARLLTSGLSLASLVVGTLGALLGLDDVRTVGLLAYCLAGLGFAPWNLLPQLATTTRVVLAGLTGLTVATAVSMGMMQLGSWHPVPVFTFLAVLSGAAHGLALVRAWADLPSAYRRRVSRRYLARAVSDLPAELWPVVDLLRRHLATIVAVTGATLCLVGAAVHGREAVPPFWGFPADIGVLWWVGLALLLTAVVLAVVDGRSSLSLAVVLLVLVTVVTPALVYEGPRSQSAQKHVDFVQQIRSVHELRSSVAVYDGWPGFFASSAWWCDVAGISDPLKLATAWPALIAGLRLAALRHLAGQLLRTPRAAWVAVVLAALADPIGADYFSPQSVGFVLGLIVYGLALDRSRTVPTPWLILLAGCLIAVTHQLSPYVVGGVLVVLVVFRLIRPWWTPMLLLGPAVVWAVLHFEALARFLSLDSLGDPGNLRPPHTPGSADLSRLTVVPASVAALLVCIGVVGLIALVTLVRTWRSSWSWALAASPGVALVLVVVNSYGQEGIFRAVLFGMPWLAVLATPTLLAPRWGLPWRPRRPGLHRAPALAVRLAAVLTVLTAAFLVAAFALDRLTVVRRADLTVLAALERIEAAPDAPQRVVIFLGEGNLPTTVAPPDARSVELRLEDLDLLYGQRPADEVAGQGLELTRALERGAPAEITHVYVVWSPTISDYSWAYGVQTPDQFAALRDGLLALPQWSVVAQDGGTLLLRFDRPAPAAPAAPTAPAVPAPPTPPAPPAAPVVP
ncbi:hypothetical protein [Kineococcus sp. SYSU DK003]|uniref:hypothetical protein n=1 Tax=Kineococcus sp. SYSU DK003 TaxID=3383124 RepID=UPI003D7D0627